MLKRSRLGLQFLFVGFLLIFLAPEAQARQHAMTKMMGFFHAKELAGVHRELVPPETWHEQSAPECFQGYRVNWENIYFFRGDAGELNALLHGLSERDMRFSIVLDPNAKFYHDPTKPVDPEAIPDPATLVNFMVYTSPFTEEDMDANAGRAGGLDGLKPVVRVTVYLGSEGIALADLDFPDSATVTANGEVEGFVERIGNGADDADADESAESDSDVAPPTEDADAPD